ncbi:MAG: hypothetical protein KDB53_17725 [Planctomycetes bacterium]|nr:hypothetical protein [Planctomycetota bacterium]
MQFTGGYGQTPMPLSALFELSSAKNRPALVYVHGMAEDAEKAEEMDQKLFGDEDFVLASRFFRFYRINEADVTDESIREKYLSKLPAFILLDAQGNEVDTMNGRNNHRRLTGSLSKLFSKHYVGSMKKHLSALSKHLKEIERAEDKVADAQRFVDFSEERVESRSTPQAERQLAEKKAELAEAVKVFEALKGELDALTSPEIKDEKVAKN